MKEFWNVIQTVITAIGGWLGWYLGGCDGLLYVLVAFMVMDYITGVMRAIIEHKLSSAVGFKGIAKKVYYLLLVGIAHLLDAYVVGSGAVLRTAVIFSLCANEGVSLTENAGAIGFPIPEPIKRVLKVLHEKGDAPILGVGSADDAAADGDSSK